MRSRLPFLSALLAFAVLLGGANGCSSDPNVVSARIALESDPPRYDEALAQVDMALETDGQNVEAHALKVQILTTQLDQAPLLRKGEIAPPLLAATQAANRVGAADPEVMRWTQAAWGTLMNSGNTSIRSEDADPSQAVALFDAAATIAPDSAASQFGLGLAHLINEDAAAAAPVLARALQLDPADANAAIYLSRAYLQLDRGAEALDVLADARADVDPTDEAYDRLQQEYLNALASSGQTDRAISEFEQQIENYPDDPLIRYNYGTLLLNTDRFTEAIEQFEVATELNAQNADAFYNLGVANLREAGRLETEAGTLDLSQQEQYDSLIAQRDERLEVAIDALETARDLTEESNRPVVCSTLLTIYNSLGRAEEAQEAAECAGVSMD